MHTSGGDADATRVIATRQTV